MAAATPGYRGTGYVADPGLPGDECRFTVNLPTAGGYIIHLRYDTSGYRDLGFLVNGQRRGTVKLGKSEQVYATWTERSLLTWLDSGSNTLTFRCEQSQGAVNFDQLTLALYSTNRAAFIDDFAPAVARPFGGANWPLPGTIEAENYDLGGEGVAYHDSDAVNQGGAYRNDGVDIQTSSDVGGGYQVGWTADGEWLQYTVDASPGCYHFTARVASALTQPMRMGVQLDGEPLGEVDVPGTGGWYNFVNVAIPNVGIAPGGQGRHMRLEIIRGGFNINWFRLDATNGMCAPRLQLLGVDSTNLVLGWQSIAGRSYGVMTSSNPAASSWQVLTNLTVQTNGPMAVTCPRPPSESYYRLRLEP